MIHKQRKIKSNNSIIHFPASTSMAESNFEKPHLSLASNEVPVISVHFNKPKLKLKVGQEEKVYATVLPTQATEQGVKWAVTNKEVVEVEFHGDYIHIKAKKPGKTIIIVTTDDGQFRDLCIVNVTGYLTTNK